MSWLWKAVAMGLLWGIPLFGWAGKKDRRLDLYWVDVEGGAATLVVTPAGESILIDSGNPGTRDPERIHQVASRVAGLERIDYLVTTHFHLDHFGGAAELSKRIPIGIVYDNGIPQQNPDNNPNDTRFPLLIKPYREMSVEERRIIDPGTVIPLDSRPGTAPLKLTCVATRQELNRAQARPGLPAGCDPLPSPKAKDLSDNANSVVMLLEFGGFRFFDAGDLTWNVESTLVCPQNVVGSTVDVYQVTHHGLDQSNHPSLIQTLAPTVTIMNNGVTKGCGPETFATLSSLDSAQAHYQVHKNLREDRENNTADEYIANQDRNCSGNFIKLSVRPDGKDFTVSIPAHGHQRTFSTQDR